MKLKLYFSRPKKLNIASRIIMWRLKTDYSHVAIEVPTGPIGVLDIYQASHGTVHSLWAKHWLEDNQVIDEVIVNVETEKFFEIVRYLKKQRQKRYGFWTALASTFPFFRKLLVGKDNETHFICSELLAKALDGVIKFDTIDLDYITPKQLRSLL
jgi:hypothetical protein